MSLESATIGVARVVKGATGIKGVYALSGDKQHGILPAFTDVPDAPVALVYHDHFEVDPGSFEITRHWIQVDVYLRGTEPQTSEIEQVRVVDAIRAEFREHTNLFGALDGPGRGGFAVITAGGPSEDTEVNGQPFNVYPMIVRATDGSPQTYTGGPDS